MYEMRKGIVIIVVIITLLGLSSLAYATEEDNTIALINKDIMEKLARIEEGQKALNQRIDDLGKRIDGQGRRLV